MSSDGSFENLSNVEMDSREPVAQDAPNQNQMILKEIEAIRHLIENVSEHKWSFFISFVFRSQPVT